MDRYSVTFLQKCINPITVGGGSSHSCRGEFFPYPQNFKSFDIQGNSLLISPHRYVTIIYRSSLLWLEEKIFLTCDNYDLINHGTQFLEK